MTKRIETTPILRALSLSPQQIRLSSRSLKWWLTMGTALASKFTTRMMNSWKMEWTHLLRTLRRINITLWVVWMESFHALPKRNLKSRRKPTLMQSKPQCSTSRHQEQAICCWRPLITKMQLISSQNRIFSNWARLLSA